MHDRDTTMGGRRDAFPHTTLPAALFAAPAGSAERREAMNRFIAAYWRPVYRYIRCAWGRGVEAAKDLTQGFFAELLDGTVIARYEPARGRFRSYLKGALRKFLAEDHRTEMAQKRGGDVAFLSLDVDSLERDAAAVDTRHETPEAAFDRQWARDQLATAVDRLRSELAAEGRADQFRIYEQYELGDAAPTYAHVAQTTGLSVSQITNVLHRVRERLREILTAIVADSVSTREEFHEEMRELFIEPPESPR
jgi:RNA polymerase sigma-70 factor (ECF subfamily)